MRTTDEDGVSHYYGHGEVSREIAEKVMTDLRSEKRTKDKVCFLVEHHDEPVEETEKAVQRRIGKYGYENYRDLLLLRRADRLATGTSLEKLDLYDSALAMAEETERKKNSLSLATLKIDGNDLIAMGCREGKSIGLLLSKLLDAVSEGRCSNEKNALSKLAEKMIKENAEEK